MKLTPQTSGIGTTGLAGIVLMALHITGYITGWAWPLLYIFLIVSGIGQGGDGQLPGTGVVRLEDLDDVNINGIGVGDIIIWDGSQFIPIDGSGIGSWPS